MGCLLKIENYDAQAVSHAMIPTPIILSNLVLRVYYSSRDLDGLGRPRYADFDLQSNFALIKHSNSFVLDVGVPGAFDDNGVVACSVIEMEDQKFYLYYAGFELSTKIRYRIFTGLAESSDRGERFHRVSKAPILDRTDSELFFRGGPFVQRTRFGYEMYYVGGGDWIQLENSLKPVYTIKKSLSLDGILWDDPVEVLQSRDENEHGFGRPYPFEWNGRNFLAFSVRDSFQETYRLGFAEFIDDLLVRKDHEFQLFQDKILIENRELMYAAFFSYDDDLYMLYNTKDFGLEGIFIAKLESLD